MDVIKTFILLGIAHLFLNTSNKILNVIGWIIYAYVIVLSVAKVYLWYKREIKQAEIDCYNQYCLKQPISQLIQQPISQCESQSQSIMETTTNPNFGGYRQTVWSILDAVPPPDQFHEYREDGFNHEPTTITDYDRWNAVWKPNSDYSIHHQDLSNDFLL